MNRRAWMTLSGHYALMSSTLTWWVVLLTVTKPCRSDLRSIERNLRPPTIDSSARRRPHGLHAAIIKLDYISVIFIDPGVQIDET